MTFSEWLNWEITYWKNRLLGRCFKCQACGSSCRIIERYRLFDGHRRYIEQSNETYCSYCLALTPIRCAWCERVIEPGDEVSLYKPANSNFYLPERAVVYNHKPLEVVVCHRPSCVGFKIESAGRWLPPGRLKRATD